MSRTIGTAIVTLLWCITANQVYADTAEEGEQIDEDELYRHPLTDIPEPSPTIQVGYTILGYDKEGDLRFPMEEKVTILCGIINNGDHAMNVTYMMGSVNSPLAFKFHTQNFTRDWKNTTVEPGVEHTFEYSFKIHPSVTASQQIMAMSIFYEDEEERFATTFLNKTIDIYEAHIGGGGAMSFYLFALFILGAGYTFHAQKDVDSTKAAARETSDVSDGWEDLAGGSSSTKKAKAKKKSGKK